MGNVLDATAARLVAELGWTLDVDLHLGRMPDEPDLSVAVIEYGGGTPVEVFADAPIAVDMPMVQLVSRGPRFGYLTARDRLVQARRTLLRAPSGTYSGLTVLRWKPTTSVLSLGPDEQERPTLSCNLMVQHAEEPAP